MTEFNGFLYSKLQNMGTRSEGPAYYLQQADYQGDVLVEKRSSPWEADDLLQKFLGMKVKMIGEIVGDALRYSDLEIARQS